jgi:predicted DNA-binding transcriptional regulator AlpA
MDEPMKSKSFTARASARWYFLCDRCQAKWFDAARPSSCPRCGHSATSNEKFVPPWQTSVDKPCDAAGNDGDCICENDPAAILRCPSHSLTVLVTASQLAGWLQVSKRSLYRLRSAGQLPEPVRLGGTVRWRAADLEAWLASDCRT